jgi:hypothetical protein
MVAYTASRKKRIHSRLPPRSRCGLRAHDQREALAVAEFVVAPALEPAKDRVEALVGVALELAEDGDVARVADLLGQVGRVEDVLGLEVGVGLGALEPAQVQPRPKSFRLWLMKPAWRDSSRAMKRISALMSGL